MSDGPGRLLPAGAPRGEALAMLERFRRGERLPFHELFLLLLRLATPGEMQALGVAEEEHGRLKLELSAHLTD